MNLKQLRSALRTMMGDIASPQLWSDEDLNRYLNNAVREICIRARLLKDDADSQPSLCRKSFSAGDAHIRFDPSILVVRSAHLVNSHHHRLWALSAESMDKQCPGWDTRHQRGTPEYMVVDLSQKSFRLHPTPDVDGELHMRVWRTPNAAEQMCKNEDEPVVHIPDDEEMCHWAASEAYMINDSELRSEDKAAGQLALFEQRFGSRPSLHEMARWADSPPRVRHARMF